MVAQRRTKDDFQRATILAWQMAAFGNMAMHGKLPPVSTFLAVRRPTGDMRTQLTAVAKVVGIALRPASPAAIRAFKRPVIHGDE